MGKMYHLYSTKDHTFVLHNLLNGSGIQSIAQFSKEALFNDYCISSQNDDRITFAIDLSLIHRALRNIINIYTEFSSHGGGGLGLNRLQIKPVKKLSPYSIQRMSFLTFETKGYKSDVIQYVPISKVALDALQEMLRTLVRVPDMNQLEQFVDRMKQKLF